MSFYRQGPVRPSGPTMNIGVPGLTPMVKTLMIVCAVVWAIQLMAGHHQGTKAKNGKTVAPKPRAQAADGGDSG